MKRLVLILALIAGGACSSDDKTDKPADVSYKSCDEVRAAGKAPLKRDQPGYSTKLDRDGDGVACD